MILYLYLIQDEEIQSSETQKHTLLKKAEKINNQVTMISLFAKQVLNQIYLY